MTKVKHMGIIFHTNAKKIIGYSISIIGMLLVVLTLISDLIRKRTYQFGPAQIIVLIFGLGLIILGFFTPNILGKNYKKITWHPKIIDFLIIFGFIIYAALFFWGKWDGLTPTIDFSSDASVLSGFAAAYDHPENFTQDLLLGNPQYSLPYRLFLIPVVNLLTEFSNDYSLSLLLLLPISVFLQLTGFYFLGKILYKNRVLAVLLTLFCAINIQFGAGDYWGFFSDPQPRFIYQSLVPFLLLLFFNSLKKPKRWPMIMFFTGVVGYIHLLSNSAIALMIWVSFFFNKPDEYSMRKLLFLQFINAFVYLITTIPVFLVMSSTSSFIYFVNIPSIISKYFLTLQNLGIGFLALISTIFFYVYNRRVDPISKNLIVWVGSLWFYALLVPLLEYKYSDIIGLTVFPLDVIRNLRYTFPLLFILILYNMRTILIKVRAISLPISNVGIGLSVIIFLFFSVTIVKSFTNSPYYFDDYGVKALSCFRTKNIFCPSQYQSDATEVLRYIKRNTPNTAKILAAPNNRLDEQIRYGGERTSSLVQSDAPRLPYVVAQSLQGYFKQLEELSNMKGRDQLEGSIDLACELGSDYLLLNRKYALEVFDQTKRVKLVFQNDNFDLVKIKSCSN